MREPLWNTEVWMKDLYFIVQREACSLHCKDKVNPEHDHKMHFSCNKSWIKSVIIYCMMSIGNIVLGCMCLSNYFKDVNHQEIRHTFFFWIKQADLHVVLLFGYFISIVYLLTNDCDNKCSRQELKCYGWEALVVSTSTQSWPFRCTPITLMMEK